MSLARASLRRPISVMVCVIAIVLAGALALSRMRRDILPNLGVPMIYVAQPYGGMDPAQMEGFLTNYYEYHFLYVTGIEHVESKSIQGVALMKLQFHPGTDMSQAMAETINYVEPRAGVHAAGHGAAVHHALRHRQRAGRLPGLLERAAQRRRDPGPGSLPRAPDVRDPARRLGAAAVRRRASAACW